MVCNFKFTNYTRSLHTVTFKLTLKVKKYLIVSDIAQILHGNLWGSTNLLYISSYL